MGQGFSLGSLSISHTANSYGMDILEMLFLVSLCIFIMFFYGSVIAYFDTKPPKPHLLSSRTIKRGQNILIIKLCII